MIQGVVIKLNDGTWTAAHSDELIDNLAELLASLPAGTTLQISSPDDEEPASLAFDFMEADTQT
jgi:hypothetical protein